jgi:hypothetical protein
MEKISFLILIILLSLSSVAQAIVVKKNEDFLLSYDDGSLVIKKTSYNEEGTTSVPERNCKVTVKANDGKVYSPLYGRIDLLTGKFIFTINGQDLICAVPVQQIVFDSCYTALNSVVFKNGYPPIDKQNDKNFYQLLSEGKATLLKHYELKWQDVIPYTSTNTTRIYTQTVKYYLYSNNRMDKLGKNNKNLTRLLAITPGYLKKLDLKKEDDMIKLLAYYNSL